MIADNAYGMLNTPEACQRFREQYQDTVFRSAYTLSGSYTRAQALTEAFFDETQQTYRERPLPDAMEMYILSRVNFLFAKGAELHRPEKSPQPLWAQKELSSSPASGEGILLGQVFYVPSRDLAQTALSREPERDAPKQAAADVSAVEKREEPSAKPPEPPRDENTIRAVFDPEITRMWTPEMEGEHPRRVEAVVPPKPKKAFAEASAPRSVPLTVINTVLTLTAIGAAVFLIFSLGIF